MIRNNWEITSSHLIISQSHRFEMTRVVQHRSSLVSIAHLLVTFESNLHFLFAETRGVGYLIEGPERVNPCQPAKCPPSTLVYIRCLVRPFTLGTLTKMIEQHFGAPALNQDLWLDRIKSSAVVRMNSVEEATR